jgi:hypothetical protein
MVALFIGSICSIWHNMLTTVLFRYSGMGKIPAKTEQQSLCRGPDNENDNNKTKYTEIFKSGHTHMLTICLCSPNFSGTVNILS